ncbi:hypothetical protein KS4_28070 [Poriferisphaera corsica]|uniref:DUF4149 domain-containing protein n=1 Tax=Poriferisphaera corsica TaxID=2528020 RepID=A0A517YWX4_9BACT|nr:hypothetical protein [Poriferisphaera corsica]QDU34733.1 hypothetical protein KS4_28070 [Poriferisphaera corsica]
MTKLIQSFYYLFLGSWLGSLIMLALTAAASFKTLRTYQAIPGIEPYNLPIFANKYPEILAGAVVGQSVEYLTLFQIICAIGTFLALFLNYTINRKQNRKLPSFIRTTLYLLTVATLLIHIFLTAPSMNSLRDKIYNPDITQTDRDAAYTKFQSLHKFSERSTGSAVFLLAAIILISPFTQKPRSIQPLDSPPTNS